MFAPDDWFDDSWPLTGGEPALNVPGASYTPASDPAW